MKKEKVLKILPEFFEEVVNGNKRAELRLNDRDYKVGDIYDLNEWDGKKFTGRGITIRITHILQGYKGLEGNYCMFSFVTKAEDCEKSDYQERISILNRGLEQSREALVRAKDEIAMRDSYITELETTARVLGGMIGRR